jgi:hypothetical protein
MAETTVGSILMSLAGELPLNEAAVASISNPRGCSPSSSVVMFETSGDVGLALEKLKTLVSSELSDDEEMLEVDRELLSRDKATCTSSDLDKIRRERNRMHAKKTRLRKKKIMRELELVRKTLFHLLLFETHLMNCLRFSLPIGYIDPREGCERLEACLHIHHCEGLGSQHRACLLAFLPGSER